LGNASNGKKTVEEDMATNVIGMKTDAKVAQQEGLKTCPRCGATTFTDMGICYGCLFDFLEGSSDETRVNVPQMFVDNLRHEAESRATVGKGDATAGGEPANDAPSLYAEESEPWGSLDELWDEPAALREMPAPAKEGKPCIRVIAPDLPIEIEVMGSNVTVRQITAAED
jgi:hypothetical protein